MSQVLLQLQVLQLVIQLLFQSPLSLQHAFELLLFVVRLLSFCLSSIFEELFLVLLIIYLYKRLCQLDFIVHLLFNNVTQLLGLGVDVPLIKQLFFLPLTLLSLALVVELNVQLEL